MVELAFEYYIRRFIQINLLSQQSAVNIYESNTDYKYFHDFITGNKTLLDPYNSGSPQFCTVEPYEAIDTCKAVCMV